jgi:hypothetical protein
MFEADVERTTCELRAEADIDFFDVSLIAESLREDLDLRTQGEIRRCTLDVIGRLMARACTPATTITRRRCGFGRANRRRC